MSQTEKRPLNIICVATYFKGADFIRECKAHGCHVILVTKEKMLGEDWPRESLDDLIAVPNDAGPAPFIDLLYGSDHLRLGEPLFSDPTAFAERRAPFLLYSE